MKIQVDFIHRLVQRQMFHVIEEIFSYLKDRNLRYCELVSKSWYFAIRNDNIWKKRFERKANTQPHFYRSFLQHAQLQIENSEFFYKKLIWTIWIDTS